MKHGTFSFRCRTAAALAVVALAASAAASGTKRPVENPTIRGLREPDLLSQYERKVLSLEYAKLLSAVRAARAEAAADPSLQPLKDALAAARAAEGPGGSNSLAAARALSDATETVLYAAEGVPAKIKRLQEVGNLLEYDHRLRREQRAAAALGRPAAPPPQQTAASGAAAEEGDEPRD